MPAFNQLQEQFGASADGELALSKVELPIPQESLKYQNMVCVESIVDKSRFTQEGHVISQDFKTVIYKCGNEGRSINVLNRQTGQVQKIVSAEMVSGIKLLLDQHTLVFVEGQDLHVYALTRQKEAQVFNNVEPSVSGYQYDQLNNRVLVFQGRGNLYGLDLEGSGGAEPMFNPIEKLGGVIDAIKLYRR